MTNFDKAKQNDESKKNEFLDNYFNREKQAEEAKKREELNRSRKWLEQHGRKRKSDSLKMAVGIIAILITLGGCVAIANTDTPTNDFDWNNPEDVGDFLEWQEKKQEIKGFDDY